MYGSRVSRNCNVSEEARTICLSWKIPKAGFPVNTSIAKIPMDHASLASVAMIPSCCAAPRCCCALCAAITSGCKAQSETDACTLTSACHTPKVYQCPAFLAWQPQHVAGLDVTMNVACRMQRLDSVRHMCQHLNSAITSTMLLMSE